MMQSTPSPSVQKRYQGRGHDVCPVNFSLTREAAGLLMKYSESSPRSRGQFLSRLIVEHDRKMTFVDFLQQDGRRELQKIGRAVMKDIRRENGV